MSRISKSVLIGGSVLVLACMGLYAAILWEGSSTRAQAPWIESTVAQWLLTHTVPGADRNRTNPLNTPTNRGDPTAGGALFRQKCEICHAFDGSGHTDIAAGEYPHPPDLRDAGVQSQSDGELFYHIANGIRHTGMPAWNLSDRDTWKLVTYIRQLPHMTSRGLSASTSPPDLSAAHYVGSKACAQCHQDIYDRWKKTRMANVVRDPREHPDAIAPDLTQTDPLVTFTKDDIAFVYGSRWKQRYFKKVGDDYFPLPAQWDFTHKTWRPYFVKNGRGAVEAS